MSSLCLGGGTAQGEGEGKGVGDVMVVGDVEGNVQFWAQTH